MVTSSLLSPEQAPSCGDSTADQASMSVVVRDVPVVVQPTHLAPGMGLTQHYPSLRVEGFENLLPERLLIDASQIANGGEVRVDQIPLPPCCEIIGVWFANPVVTVEPTR